jgi:hypothetical protein
MQVLNPPRLMTWSSGDNGMPIRRNMPPCVAGFLWDKTDKTRKVLNFSFIAIQIHRCGLPVGYPPR